VWRCVQQPGSTHPPLSRPPRARTPSIPPHPPAPVPPPQTLVALLPERVRGQLEGHPQLTSLVEVVMDYGRPALARFPDSEVPLGEPGEVVTAQELDEALERVGEFGGDNRAGIDRTLHRISCIRNRAGKVVGLTCRAGRSVPGSAAMVADIIIQGHSVLLLGRPGSGKTTALREIARVLADVAQKRVVIVDTSNEIGGDGDIPHSAIGGARRMQVGDPALQHKVMIEAVENHMPEAIIIDEIGSELEAAAARTIAQRGIQLVATAHGNYLENLVKNPTLSDLAGGISSVTLSDEEARRRGVQKSILERAGPPTFDCAVEMLERQVWRIHLDVAAAVDDMLLGRTPAIQVRTALTEDTFEMTEGLARTDEYAGFSGDDLPLTASWMSGADASMLSPENPAMPPGNAWGSPSQMNPRAQRAEPREGGTAGAFGRAGAGGRGPGGRGAEAVGGAATELRSRGDVAPELDAVARDGGHPPPNPNAVRVYLADIPREDVVQVAESMGALGEVVLTTHLSGADAVLALRSKLKSGGWVKRAAKAAGVPIYAVKSASATSLVKAVKTLTGREPSAGGVFGKAGLREETQLLPDSVTVSVTESMDADAAETEAETEVEVEAGAEGEGGEGAGAQAVGGTAVGAGGARSAPEDPQDLMDAAYLRVYQEVSKKQRGFGPPPKHVKDALEEARLAVEDFARVMRGPMELLPRPAEVLEMQALLVTQELGAECERVGEGASTRLRVFVKG